MGQHLAIGQKMISTGHELEISSWGMDPISNQSGGKENSMLFLVTQDSIFRVCQKWLEPTIQKKYLLFEIEIRVGFFRRASKFVYFFFLYMM